MNIFLTEICFDFQSRFFLEVSRATFKKVGKQITMKKNQLCESRFFLYFLHWQCKFFFIFCISNANCFYFWHWKCKLGINFLVNFSRWFDKFFYFLHWQCKFFFIFCIGKASFLNFLHWQCKLGINFCVNFSRLFDEFFLFFALAKQILNFFKFSLTIKLGPNLCWTFFHWKLNCKKSKQICWFLNMLIC